MHTRLPIVGLSFVLLLADRLSADEKTAATAVTSLDGTWSLAFDVKNVGREQRWWADPAAAAGGGAKPAKVPWILQGTFPGYHGVAWYWREFDAPQNPHPGGRYLLRFEQVDYLAEVWLNGAAVGGHEGGETPFTLDVTERIKPGARNRLVVRVLNPMHEMIDGICLNHLNDEWAKRHPIFEGMPSGGLLDYAYYREIIPDLVWQGQDPPQEAVAGAIKASQDYASGLMVAVYRLGDGRIVLNTLRIRENLDGNPAAERLLRNMLRYAGRR